jgi:hypothetical protein
MKLRGFEPNQPERALLLLQASPRRDPMFRYAVVFLVFALPAPAQPIRDDLWVTNGYVYAFIASWFGVCS